MTEYENYSKNAVVLEVRLSGRIRETDPPGEGSLDLKVSGVGNLILHCFMDNDTASLFYRKKIIVEDKIPVLFVLSGDYTKVQILREKAKELTWIEMEESFSNHYVAKGEIIKTTTHPEMSDSNQVVLDCGIYVFIRVVKSVPLKIGDYLQMTGRLDAHIVGKVN